MQLNLQSCEADCARMLKRWGNLLASRTKINRLLLIGPRLSSQLRSLEFANSSFAARGCSNYFLLQSSWLCPFFVCDCKRVSPDED